MLGYVETIQLILGATDKKYPFHAVSILYLEPFVCHNGRPVARGAKSVFLADTKLSKGQNSVLII